MNSYYVCSICHLTSNLLLHYLTTFECSALQLYTIVIQFKSVTDRLFTVSIYRNARLFVNGCVSDVLLQCSVKWVAGAIASYCADIMLSDVIDTQKDS